ncbi:MAG: hypothetical protein ABI954_08990, partial [Pyrinomonadaceae bacterium]
ALFTRHAGQNEAAITQFLAVLKSDKTAEFADTFGFTADQPLQQIISLYAVEGQPIAALKLAETNTALNSQTGNQLADGYQTLQERAAVRQAKSRLDLLKTLSAAAEQTADFKRAAEFERVRQNLLTDIDERQAAEARIEFLLNREKETANRPVTNFTVNQKIFE